MLTTRYPLLATSAPTPMSTTPATATPATTTPAPLVTTEDDLPAYHPDLQPYDARCNEAELALDAGRKRYQAALDELRAATAALPALVAEQQEANGHWLIACGAFRRRHGLPPSADLGYEATRHLPVHG